MLCKTELSSELWTWSHKMNLLDILSTSPHYLYRKWIGTTNENSKFDLRVWRVNVKSLTSQRRSQKHCSSVICAREENTNMLIFPSFLLAWEWLYLISTLHNTKLKAYFLLLYIALGTCTRWAKWDGPTQGCSYPRIRGQPGKILMTLNLISDPSAF